MSDLNETEKSIAEIIADVLGEDVTEIPRDTALAALGWDSLNSMEALVVMEREFVISLDLRSFHAARTVAEMARLVAKLRAGAPRTR